MAGMEKRMPTRRPGASAKRPPLSTSPRAGPSSIAGAAFWALIDRWEIPDEAALRLIAGPSLTKTQVPAIPADRRAGREVCVFARD
jgi:hypothetical protein